MSLRERDMTCGDGGLDALAGVVRDAFEPMPEDARARVRGRLDAALSEARVPFFVRFARPLVALAVGASMVGGVSAAAASSSPGDAFYPVKASVQAMTRSVERPAAKPKLTPIAKPSATPAAAVEKADKAGKAPSAVRTPAGKRTPAPAVQHKPGKSGKTDKKTPPAKGKSSGGKNSSRSRGLRSTTKP